MRKAFAPIAVVGRGCLLPGCQNPRELWKIIEQAAVTVSRVPEGYWRVSPDKVLRRGRHPSGDHAFCSEGGYIRDFAFDPSNGSGTEGNR